MKIELKHIVYVMIFVGLTTLFQDELKKGLHQIGLR